ncbi:peptidyl-prolyl cis-trans isomerase [Thermotoga sp. KOL6]|uniref:peptidyl-prolyl cis-trans isomerase n=1 Tax=Thermotoga sp. KOL6 TaxID=126741 RepID=UPI000C75D79A|nr:peptidyl-prolyl cis-trans isomerase [Thermotoga sp. KOL6]PLV58390.1 hypothetical protein AS005_08485 [Thermotoga sp. KOL6]
MKKVIFLSLMAMVVTLFSQATTTSSTIVAIVNGEPITSDLLEIEADVSNLLKSIAQIDTRFFNVLTGTEEGLKLLLKYKLEVLNSLIDDLLIQQLAEKEGVGVTEEEANAEVEKRLKETVETMGITLEDLDKFLQSSGYGDLETFKKRLIWHMKTQLSLQRLQEKITQSATVTSEEAQKYYNENKESFRIPAAVHLYRIVAKEKNTIDEALSRIRKGEEFLEVATQVATGGDLGWIEEGQLNEDIESVIFDAPEGAILGPFESKDGFVLYKIVEKRTSSYKTFDEVKEEIINKLLSDKKTQLWSDWFEKAFEEFKKKSQIEIKLGGSGK